MTSPRWSRANIRRNRFLSCIRLIRRGLKQQPLDQFSVGQSYTLRVHELEGSLWHAVKCKDDSNLIDLLPYIQLDDENKFPSGAH